MITSSLSATIEWNKIPTSEGGTLRHICLDSSGTHWGIAQTGSLYKLESEMNTWQEVDVDHTYYSVNNIFADDNGGVFISSYLQLIYTNDNGITWNSLELPPGVNRVEPSYRGCFYGFNNDGTVYKSLHKGKSWEKYKKFSSEAKFTSLPNTDYFSSSSYLGTSLIKTTDCGESDEFITNTFGNDVVHISDVKYHTEGIAYVSVLTKNPILEYEINLFKKDDTDEEFTKVARYINDTNRTIPGNSLGSYIYIKDNRTIVIAIDKQYILDTVYDNSITIIREYKSDNNLKYNKFEGLELNGVRGKYASLISSDNYSFYANFFDGLYSYNQNEDEWEQEESFLDSGYVRVLGKTDDGDLFGYSADDKYFYKYDRGEKKWEKTHTEPITVTYDRLFYNYGKLIFQHINHDFISYDYGKTIDTLIEVNQNYDGGKYRNEEYIITNNQGFYCGVTKFKINSETSAYSVATHLRYYNNSYKVAENVTNISDLYGFVATFEIKANVAPTGNLFLSTNLPFEPTPLLISTDNGVSYSDYSIGLSGNAVFQKLVFSDNGQRMILATSDGLYFRHSVENRWVDITPPNSSRYIRDVVLLSDMNIYAVDYNGKLFASDILVSVENSTSYNNSVTTFPNPTSGSLTIESQEIIKSYTIIDMVGKTIRERTTEAKKLLHIDLSSIGSGNYIVKVETIKGEIINKSIIITN